MNKHDVLELLAQYAWSHDSRDFERLAGCFTADAAYTMQIADGQPSNPTVGAQAIAELVKSFKANQTDQRRHVITNVVFDEFTADFARTRSYVTVLATEGESLQVVTTGICTDEIVCQDGNALFTSKAMHLDKGF